MYFLSTLLILIGSAAFTAGILRRFVFRKNVVFDLTGPQGLLLTIGGILLLLISIALYVWAGMSAE